MHLNEPEHCPFFDFERLIVYQKTMELRCLINPLTLNPPRGAAHLADHLDRAMGAKGRALLIEIVRMLEKMSR